METLHELAKDQAVQGKSIENLEKSADYLWKAVGEIRGDVGRIKVEVAKVVAIVGIVQVIITGVMVWTLTKSKEEKHAARQVHQTEVRSVVGVPAPPSSWRPD